MACPGGQEQVFKPRTSVLLFRARELIRDISSNIRPDDEYIMDVFHIPASDAIPLEGLEAELRFRGLTLVRPGVSGPSCLVYFIMVSCFLFTTVNFLVLPRQIVVFYHDKSFVILNLGTKFIFDPSFCVPILALH